MDAMVMLQQPEDIKCWAQINERKKCDKRAVWIYREYDDDDNAVDPAYTQLCEQHYSDHAGLLPKSENWHKLVWLD